MLTDDGLHVLTPQFGGIHAAELLALQWGKEAFPACIAMAVAGAAHALYSLVAPERLLNS